MGRKEQPPFIKEITPVTFSRDKILKFKRYASRVDLLRVLLGTRREYSLDEVDTIIDDFLKGRVK
jgi:hypothetical protein